MTIYIIRLFVWLMKYTFIVVQATEVRLVKSVCEYKEYGFIIKEFNQALISTSIYHSAHCKQTNKRTNKQKPDEISIAKQYK